LRAARAAALTFGAGERDELEDDEGEEKKGPGAERERRPLRKELRSRGIGLKKKNPAQTRKSCDSRKTQRNRLRQIERSTGQ
jgi:hypothetical protein